MNSYEFGGFVSFTLAIILLFIGKTTLRSIRAAVTSRPVRVVIRAKRYKAGD